SMADANVGAETGSAGESVIDEQDIGKEYITANSQLDALVALDNGSIDVAIIDSVMAGYYTSTGAYKGKMVVVENLVLAQEEYGIAAKKGNEAFMSKINEALLALIDTDYKTVAEDFGLTASCSLSATMTNQYATATDNSWNEIVSSGKIIIGYTVFAPIAYNA
ncbi:MAG: transporter substrate-binding domain-containing protein, partial [Clostridia bacterium]|nr:transporter substrate-binding domain-containing protein [Clostridia bacterium]